MHLLHRFLYGTILGSLIIWTIYLLTIDFYSLFFASYQSKHIIYAPFLGNGFSLHFFITINLATLLLISCSALITQFKNTKILPWSLYHLKHSEEKFKA